MKEVEEKRDEEMRPGAEKNPCSLAGRGDCYLVVKVKTPSQSAGGGISRKVSVRFL